MTAIIIDDEAHCIDSLKHDLSQYCADVEVAATCRSAEEGIRAIRKHEPDFIFLDVQMPVTNGFEMLSKLDQPRLQVIFTTAYDRFATKAFRVNAIDYLLKPVDSHDLIAAVDKVRCQLEKATPSQDLEHMMQLLKTTMTQPRIALATTRDGYELVLPDEIIYFKAEGAYTHVILSEGRRHLVSKSLGEMEQALPQGHFERVHHSLLVNLRHVTQFKKNDGTYIIMNNGDELSVSKSRREGLLKRLGIKSV